MQLQIIQGPPGTGKTRLMLQQICDAAAAGSARPLYFIVPEQFTLSAERLLLDALSDGGAGAAGSRASLYAQVISFSRLAHRIFTETGPPQDALACETMCKMLISRAIHTAHLQYYKNLPHSRGLIDEAHNTIVELSRQRITPQDMRIVSRSGVLEKKLADVAAILEAFGQLAAAENLRPNFCLLDALCDTMDAAPQIALLDAAHIWLDGFGGFSAQEYAVLERIFARAARVSVALTTCSAYPDTFLDTRAQLLAIARRTRADATTTQLNEPRRYISAQMRAAAGLLCSEPIPAGPDTAHVRIITAANAARAAEYAAQRTEELVQQGYRYNDIAIIANPEYTDIVQTTFEREGIPLFVDREICLMETPIAMLICDALKAVQLRFGRSALMCCAKNPLCGISAEAADILENHAIARNISGRRFFFRLGCPTADAARVRLMTGFGAYADITPDSEDTVDNHARRVFGLLQDCGAIAAMQTAAAAAEVVQARQAAQVWECVCGMFDKLVQILGAQQVTHAQFADIVRTGLSSAALHRIPPRTNSVILGDVYRSRFSQISALICLGANDGKMPAGPDAPGLFSDAERVQMENCTGLRSMDPGGLRALRAQMCGLHTVLCQPSERLEIIYTTHERDGDAAYFVSHIAAALGLTPVPAHGAPEVTAGIAADAFSQPAGVPVAGDAIAITGLERFAACPLMHFLQNTLGLRPRADGSVSGADAGTWLHNEIARHGTADPQASPPPLNLPDNTPGSAAILKKVSDIAESSAAALQAQVDAGSFAPMAAEVQMRLALDAGIYAVGRADRVCITPDGFVSIVDFKSGASDFSLADCFAGVNLQLALYMAAWLAKNPDHKPGGIFNFGLAHHIVDADDAPAEHAQALQAMYKLKGLLCHDGARKFDRDLGSGQKSAIVPLSINQNGEFAKSAALLTRAEFAELLEHAVRTAATLARRMHSGEIAPKPRRRGARLPCDYCGYGGVCGR